MDFIEQLSESQGFTEILVVVDRLTIRGTLGEAPSHTAVK